MNTKTDTGTQDVVAARPKPTDDSSPLADRLGTLARFLRGQDMPLAAQLVAEAEKQLSGVSAAGPDAAVIAEGLSLWAKIARSTAPLNPLPLVYDKMADTMDSAAALLAPKPLGRAVNDFDALLGSVAPVVSHAVVTTLAEKYAPDTGELVEPDGWYLSCAEHQHTAGVYMGETRAPLPYAKGPWRVVFQKMDADYCVDGRGHTMREAWESATRRIAEYEQERE